MNKYIAILLLVFSGLVFATEKDELPSYEEVFGKNEAGEKRKELAERIIKLKKRANQGDARAQFSLGVLYHSGYEMPPNYKIALKWYKLAVKQKHAHAQLNLGHMYYNGNGVLQDYITAIRFYELSASQNNIDAQIALGVMYYDGRSGNVNYIKAHMWWNIAASQNSFPAEENRRKAEMKMEPNDILKAQQLARECVAKNYKGC